MHAAEDPGSLESSIGLYWLNRLGVGSLVVGLALALLLSFFSLPAILKVATGFLCAAALLLSGELLIRKTDITWYGQGLIGGGWSLAFFTAFAAHHMPAVRVIGSSAVDTVLLLAIAAASMFHAIRRRSQTIAALAGLLGTFTICLTPVSFFTAAACALLNLGICGAATAMGWSALLVVGCLGFYGSYYLSASPFAGLPITPLATGLGVSSAMLVPTWFMYSFSIPFFDEHEPGRKRALVALTCLNALAFVAGALTTLDTFAPDWRSPFLIVTGVVYALSLWAVTKENLPTISTINQLMALSLATVGISEKLSGTWLSPFWLAEVAVLTFLGLRYGIKEFRWFAALVAPVALARVVAIDCPLQLDGVFVRPALVEPVRPLILGTATLASFAFAAAMHRTSRYLDVQGPVERPALFYLYITLVSAAVACFPLLGLPGSWRAAVWACGGAALICAGLRLPDAYPRMNGFISLILATAALMTRAPGWEWAPTILAACALLVTGRHYGIRTDTGKIFSMLAVFVVSFLFWFKLSADWLSIFLTAEGFLLVLSGFYLSLRSLRIVGLVSFGALVIRLLLLELARADSGHAVISFCAGGAVLLAASWVYAFLNARYARIQVQSEREDERSDGQRAGGPLPQGAPATGLPG